ncbi:DUF4142 domain-containing protein [Coralloluteibacterium thermophilus]|uniref:DUF4142 domain-containing protein n=1 Tax=Coralloluteibacterium thermophilum TaxID=2707049 RepID=A0ABV9NJH8_9GAMM
MSRTALSLTIALALAVPTVHAAQSTAGTQPRPATTGQAGAEAGSQTGTRSDRAAGQADRARGGAAATLNAADRTFVEQATRSNETEIAAANLALEKGRSEEVRQFAQRMLTDHRRLAQQMTEAVGPPPRVEPDRAVIARLERADGAEFDAAYSQAMVAEHQKAVALFERTANDDSHSAPVRTLARGALPTLQQHHESAQSLEHAGHGGRSDGGAARRGD